MSGPLQCIWTGEAFRPASRYAMTEAGNRYGAGEVVLIDPERPRSKVTHDHFFAVVTEAHATLPESMGDRFPTPDSLRHYALCKAGHCDVETFVASSRAEALRLAGFCRAGAKEGVQVVVNGASITRLTPHSQSQRAMGAKTFQESKAAVLSAIADLLEATPDKMAVAA
jgi:hypothetical protein